MAETTDILSQVIQAKYMPQISSMAGPFMTSSVGMESQSIWERIAILLKRLSLRSAAFKEIGAEESGLPCLSPLRSFKVGSVCKDGGKRGSVYTGCFFWKLALWRRHRKDPAWVVGAQRHLYSFGAVLLVSGRADGGMYIFSPLSCVSTSSQLLGRLRNFLLPLIPDRSGKLEIRRPEVDMTITVSNLLTSERTWKIFVELLSTLKIGHGPLLKDVKACQRLKFHKTLIYLQSSTARICAEPTAYRI